jgi:hypothetical protein
MRYLVYSSHVGLTVTELAEYSLAGIKVEERQTDRRRDAATLAHGADDLLVLDAHDC